MKGIIATLGVAATACAAFVGIVAANPGQASASSCDTDACLAHNVAPVGYHYDVTSSRGYHFHKLAREDSRGPGVWNAAQRGNKQGVSFVHLRHGNHTLYLGVNDKRQGGAYNGVVAWERHHPTRVSNEVIYKSHYGFVSEVDTTVRANGRTFYVEATAIWPKQCYCE